jgi:leucyl/phenylalanyl-tRNA--protein transferase
MVFRLSNDYIAFPDPALAEGDGLLAIGGDLSVARLKLAYASGIFPWYSEEEPILWYAPQERCVLFPNQVKISKSMRKTMRDGSFTITMDQAFEEVIHRCANAIRNGQDGTWITGDMQKAYIDLYQQGIAHSIEVWHQQQLVGGLYGVQTGTVFCGESMFSEKSSASKAALIWLCREQSFTLIDCQMPNPHLMSMGAVMISRETYQSALLFKTSG